MTRKSAAPMTATVALLLSSIANAAPPHGAIDAYVTRQMDVQHVPGLALTVIDKGKIAYAKGYGKASLDSGAPVNLDTTFAIGSLTKTFTASALMILVQDGKLQLDDHLRQFIPEAPPSWDDITLHQLLNHTAGLATNGSAVTRQTALAEISERELLESAFAQPLQGRPGAAFSYSNLGYDLLSIVVTRVSGEPFMDFLRHRIFEPAQMKATGPYDRTEIVRGRAAGYLWSRGALRVCMPYSASRFRGSASLQSTARDLARWDATLRTDGVLSASTRKLMWTADALADGKPISYGLGWELGSVAGHRLVGHNGALNGYLVSLQRYLDDDLTVIVMLNQSDLAESRKIAEGVARLFLPGLHAASIPAAAVVSHPTQALLDEIGGYYEYWENYMLSLVPGRAGIAGRFGGGGPDEYLLLEDGALWQPDSGVRVKPVRDAAGSVIALTVENEGGRVIQKVAPVFASIAGAATSNADRARATAISLQAMENGVSAVQADPGIAAGRKRDFSASPDFGSLRSVEVLHAQDVDGRGVVRHGEAVTSVLACRVHGELFDSNVLVFLTREGLITDFDLVE